MATNLTKKAVLAAVKEYNSKTRTEFLKEYGFRKARDYFLVIDGKNYDSKAIAAVAYKYIPGGNALNPYDLIGGKNDAAKQLRELGFTVVTPAENPDWSWDEHTLALDLYFKLRGAPFGKNHPLIKELSHYFVGRAKKANLTVTEKFRNINGVYMKLMNFRRLDDSIKSVGLKRGSQGEERVWERYAHDHPSLAIAVKLLRNGIQVSSELVVASVDESGAEGSVIVREHKFRERNTGLIKKKKAQVLQATGKLECEVCSFDFHKRYGSHGLDFIEVHHTHPIALSSPGRKTRLDELACVCSNCHRMLHRNGLQTIEWLRKKTGLMSAN